MSLSLRSLANFFPPGFGGPPPFGFPGFEGGFRPGIVTAASISFLVGGAIGIILGAIAIVSAFIVPIASTLLRPELVLLGLGPLVIGVLQILFGIWMIRLSGTGWLGGQAVGIIAAIWAIVTIVITVLILVYPPPEYFGNILVQVTVIGDLAWAVIFGLAIGIFSFIALRRGSARIAFGRPGRRELAQFGGPQGQFGAPSQFGGPGFSPGFQQQFGGFPPGGFPGQPPGAFGQPYPPGYPPFRRPY